MDKLQGVKNYIIIHNGKVIEQQIEEQVSVIDTKIHIQEATTIQILYTADIKAEYKMEILVDSIAVDIIEAYDFKNDIVYHKTMKIGENCHVSRYVTNNTDSIVNSKINDSVEVAKDGSVSCAYVEFSNSNIEANYNYDLVGENANAKLRIAALCKNTEVKKYKISLTHLAPYTTGVMDNFGVVKDTALLHIDGIGTIKKGNKQSNNQQLNKILVYNDGCVAKANPYLYIDEYDVNAGHGASVGRIDEDQLYYLQSRGLTRERAMHLVTYGYFLPVLEFVKNKQLQEQFNELLEAKVGI